MTSKGQLPCLTHLTCVTVNKACIRASSSQHIVFQIEALHGPLYCCRVHTGGLHPHLYAYLSVWVYIYTLSLLDSLCFPFLKSFILALI